MSHIFISEELCNNSRQAKPDRSFELEALVDYYREQATAPLTDEDLKVAEYFLNHFHRARQKIDKESVRQYLQGKPDFIQRSVMKFIEFSKKRGISKVDKRKEELMGNPFKAFDCVVEVREFSNSSNAFSFRENTACIESLGATLDRQSDVLRSDFVRFEIPEECASVFPKFFYFYFQKYYHKISPETREVGFEWIRKMIR